MSPAERSQLVRSLIRTLFGALGIVIILALVWMIWATWLFRGVNLRDALDSSQAARHLVRGEGFTTSVIRPLSFYFSPETAPHPDLFNPPFMTTLKAMLFLFGGVTDRMVVLASGLGWMLCGWLVYAMTRGLSGRRGAGLLALAFWCVNTVMGQYAVTGDHVLWASAFMTALIWLAARAYARAGEARAMKWSLETAWARLPNGGAMISGLVFGLLVLCEPVIAVAAGLPLLVFWLRWPVIAKLPSFPLPGGLDPSIQWEEPRPNRGPYGRKLLFHLLIPGVLVAGPWYARTAWLTWPHPPDLLRSYKAMAFTPSYPGESIYRYAEPPAGHPLVYALRQGGAVMRESLEAMLPLPEAFIYLAGLVVVVFFVVGVFVGLDPVLRFVRRLLYAILLVAIFLFSLWNINARYFAVFVPVGTVVAVLVMHRVIGHRWTKPIPPVDTPSMRKLVLEELRRFFVMTRRHQVYGLFLLLAAIPLVTLRLNLPARGALLLPPGLDYLMNEGRPDDVVLTDDPWQVAWYGQRTAVWLPQRVADLEAMEAEGAFFDWIYINNAQMADPNEIGSWWPEMIRAPEGWRSFQPVEGGFARERVLRQSIARPVREAPDPARVFERFLSFVASFVVSFVHSTKLETKLATEKKTKRVEC